MIMRRSFGSFSISQEVFFLCHAKWKIYCGRNKTRDFIEEKITAIDKDRSQYEATVLCVEKKLFLRVSEVGNLLRENLK